MQRFSLLVSWLQKKDMQNENKFMRYPQQLGRSWKVFDYLPRNSAELHQPSAPEPSRTLSAICPGTLQNLSNFLHRNPTELNLVLPLLPWLCPFWLVCESIVWLRNRAPQFLNLALPLLPCLCPFWLVYESVIWLRNRSPQFLNLILPLLPWLCPFWLVCEFVIWLRNRAP